MSEPKIIMIPKEQLYAHPDNPRRVLGDCTELADSIRVMGILQPLTVVRYNPADHPAIQPDTSDCYVTVIGHRRRKAGEMAGVEAYPAILTELTLSQQVATMMVENMSREDLTHQEEAHAIQQMLDLGESEESICKMTGFSKDTVRKRRKLLELDQDMLAAAEARGGTLSDYMELGKIKDPELRNQVLASVGTNNFAAELKKAQDTEKHHATILSHVPSFEAFAVQLGSPAEAKEKDLVFVGGHAWWNNSAITAPKDSETVKYYFLVGQDQIDLYREKAVGEVSEAESNEAAIKAAQKDVAKRLAELEEAALRAFELRLQFVRNVTSAKAKKHIAAIISFAGKYILGKCGMGFVLLGIDTSCMGDMLNVPVNEASGQIEAADYEAAAKRVPEYTMLVTAYLMAEDNSLSYHQEFKNHAKHETEVWHQKCPVLDDIYALLKTLGYAMSDEEIQLQNGTHKLFSATKDDI